MAPIKLHIGGRESHPDWKILDAEARPEVDYVGNASCLEQFADNSIAAIYASHVLEHFHHSLNNELLKTLSEWHRVLEPGGQLLVSVPNLQVVCWLFVNPTLSPIERLHLMGIMYGGQTNEYDVHKVGFDPVILSLYLREVGFQDYEFVSEFNLFNDCSSLRFSNTLISLNAVATKAA